MGGLKVKTPQWPTEKQQSVNKRGNATENLSLSLSGCKSDKTVVMKNFKKPWCTSVTISLGLTNSKSTMDSNSWKNR